MSLVLKRLFKTESEKFLAKYQPLVRAVEAEEKNIQRLTDKKLQHKTDEFKQRLQAGETLDDLLVEAFAVCREASRRVLNMRHFPVQIMGGIALHKGRAAEMKTGEGKTLVATLPSYLNALEGKGVHIVTVNDYLTERDYYLNKPLFDFLGITSGFVTQTMTPSEKQEAYHQDITYVVNTQLGFDYLNDNRAMKPEHCLQRGLHYAIIDEVDSILLDEARTPLILSQSDDDVSSWVPIIDVMVKNLEKDEYEVEIKSQSGMLTEKGIERFERILKIDNLMDSKHAELNHVIGQALLANYVFRKDKHYLVRNDRIELIDENTGRITEGRRYSHGLHQAIEAKEGVTIQKENITLASITYQYLFGYYEKISGMTGTAITEEEEFWDVYGLEVVEVPTNKPINREDHEDMVYATYEMKLRGILKDVKSSVEKGQPVLIGVSTIEQSEEIDALLNKAGIKHEVLNAKNHEREAQIIADAGQMNAVTVATNMAGRGTDIKLGKGVKEVGGLKVIGTERNMNRRVDNQLRGRSGRQGDIGESRFHVSLDDEMMEIFASDKMKGIIETLGSTAGGENGVVENRILSGFIEKTQMMLEGQHYDSRKSTIEFDGVLSAQRELIYKQRKQVLMDEVDVISLIRGQVKAVINRKVDEVFAKDGVLTNENYSTVVKDLHETFTKDYGTEALYIQQLPRDTEKSEEVVRKAVTKPISELIEERLDAFESADSLTKAQVKASLLSIIDAHWRKHLIITEEIKDGIHLVSYVGEEPLEAYFFQTTKAFNEMVAKIQTDMLRYIINTSYLQDKEFSVLKIS